jgi:hypothetical protein
VKNRIHFRPGLPLDIALRAIPVMNFIITKPLKTMAASDSIF